MKAFKFGRQLQVVLAVAMLGVTGCQNGNLFGKLHSSGSSGNTETLLADGDQALKSQDYSSAQSLFQRVLDGDPRNSRALYGAASAMVGLSGMNLGQLLANLLNKDGTISSSSLGDAIVANTVAVHSSADTLTNSILRGLLDAATSAFITTAMNYLDQIALGDTDQAIPPSDVGMLVDAAIVNILQATSLLINGGIADIVNDNGTLKVVGKGTAAAYCSDAANATTVKSIGERLAFSYALLNKATGSSTNTVISRFRDDLYKVVNEGLNGNGTADLDPACVADFAADGITATSFTTKYSL